MGLTRLSVAGEHPADLAPARTLAVHALDLLDGMERHATLQEAVRGCALVVGVTRRKGRWRKQSWLLPEDLPPKVAACGGAEVALVFGNEESGLSDDEMRSCHDALYIPTSPLFPSLNLAQAVQIVVYVLARGLDTSGPARPPAITGEAVDRIAAVLMSVLETAGFFSRGYDSGLALLYRDILARAALSPDEAERVERSFAILRSLVESGGSERRC